MAEATAALEAYRFDEYAAACYRFVWGSFCDWFLEFAKPVFNGPDGAEKDEVKGAAQHVLGVILRLLHPAIPFVTEELWDRFGYGAECSLIGAAWPEASPVAEAAAAREELDWVVRLISEVRTVRAEMNVPPSVTTPLLVQGRGAGEPGAGRALDRRHPPARPRHRDRRRWTGEAPKGVIQAVLGEATLMLPLAGVIDLGAERARLAKDRGQGRGRGAEGRGQTRQRRFRRRAPSRRWSRRTASGWPISRPRSPAWMPPWRGSPASPASPR